MFKFQDDFKQYLQDKRSEDWDREGINENFFVELDEQIEDDCIDENVFCPWKENQLTFWEKGFYTGFFGWRHIKLLMRFMTKLIQYSKKLLERNSSY